MYDNLIQPTISLEMPVPSLGHCGFPVFRLLTDFVCLLTFPLEDCSVFGNFGITLIYYKILVNLTPMLDFESILILYIYLELNTSRGVELPCPTRPTRT